MNEPTVLYIEDNYLNRRLVRKILEAHGYHVVEAEDGRSGFEMVPTLRPHLILLDIGLPGMDGLEIVARLKSDEGLRRIPILAITASAMRGDRERFLAAGCDEYLSKPIHAAELLEKVGQLLPLPSDS